MKNTITLLSILCLSLSAMSQSGGDAKKFKMTWGGPYEIPKKYADLGYIGNQTDGIIQVSIKYGKELVLQRFDPEKLTLTKETLIPIETLGDGFVVDLFKVINGKYIMFYSTWDKPREKEQLYAQEIDIKKGTFAGKPQLLIEANKIAGILMKTGVYKMEVADKYNFSFSLDSSKILITYRLKPSIKDDSVNKDVIGYYVFDSNLKKLWSKEFKMPHTEEMMDNEDYTVDMEGNGYLLSKVYEGSRKESKNDEPNYHYELLMGSEGASAVKPIVVKLEDKFIKELYAVEDFSGNMVCAGYYGVEAKGRSANGTFIVKIDKSGTVSKVKKGYYEFPLDILKMFEKKKTQAKAEKKEEDDEAEVGSLDMRGIYLSDDGSIIINGEQYNVVTTTYYSNGKMYSKTKYYYSDIFSMKINENGDMAWARKIPKSQVGTAGMGAMSFKYYSYGGNNYFMYLDNIKNLNLPPDQAPARHIDGAGGFLTVTKIDAEGNVSKGSIFDIRESDVRIWPADFDQLTPTTLFGRAYGDKQSKMLKLTYTP